MFKRSIKWILPFAILGVAAGGFMIMEQTAPEIDDQNKSTPFLELKPKSCKPKTIKYKSQVLVRLFPLSAPRYRHKFPVKSPVGIQTL